MSAFGLVAIGFGIAFAITAIEILRAGRAYGTARIRYGDVPPGRNPLDAKTASRDLKEIAKMFRPHPDLGVERARLRILRAYQVWLLLMFLGMVSALGVLLIHGPS